jgi:hypothetical protein
MHMTTSSARTGADLTAAVEATCRLIEVPQRPPIVRGCEAVTVAETVPAELSYLKDAVPISEADLPIDELKKLRATA